MKSFVAALAFATANATTYEKYSHLLSLNQEVNGFSPIQMEVDGQKKTYYVAAHFSSPGGSTYHVPPNGRGYIHETPDLDQSNPRYFKPNLIGGSVEYDVDLSHHECGCVAAFYLVKMPGKHQDGTYWMNTDGWGYCDANQVDGNYCPEFDIMEANKWAWATTPHKCDSPSNKGFYSNCDHDGQCQQNTTRNLAWAGFGPGGNYTIDTTKPFHAKISFENNNNQFSKFTTLLSQEGRTQSMSTDCSYLNYMSWDMSDGMGFVVSNWGGNATWLWNDRCSGTCNGPNLSISNIKVRTGGHKTQTHRANGGYNPDFYTFANTCASGEPTNGGGQSCFEQGCSHSPEHCRWSYPSGDPLGWHSSQVDCRCDVIAPY